MPAAIELSSFSGKPDRKGFFQILDFETPENYRFIAFLSVANKEGSLGNSIDNVFLGRSILSSIKSKYLNSGNEIEEVKRIKNAISEVSVEFKGFEKLEIAALFVREDHIYLSSVGGASTFIFRNEQLVELISTKNDEVKSASGRIKDGDILLLGSSTFFEKNKKEKLKSYLLSNRIEDFVRKLNSVEMKDVSGGATGVVALSFTLQIREKLNEFKESNNGDLELNNDADKMVGNFFKSNVDKGINDFSFHKVTSSLSSLLRKITEKKLYVSQDETPELRKKRKVLSLLGTVLIILLLGSIVYGINEKKKADIKSSYEKELASAAHNLEEAENLYQLNPARARELFAEGKTKVLGLADQGVEDPVLVELKSKIDSNQGKIMGQYETKIELFLDLNLLSDGFEGSDMSASNDSVFVFDKAGKKISETLISTKRSEIVAGPSILDNVKAFTQGETELYVANTDGIFDIHKEKIKVSSDSFDGAIAMRFYGGNLYILDKSQSLIWRLSKEGEVFGEKKSWLKENSIFDLSDATSMVIDGNIWVGTPDKVYKFGGGSKFNFELSTESIGEYEIDDIYTEEESEFLYILDKDRGRVLVFTKEGEYKSQYINEEIKGATNISVFEKEKKLILLKGNKLISTELKHL